MRASDITELAERHGIADRDGLADAFFWAGFLYDAAGADDFDEPDTLDAIEEPAAELVLLLSDEVNRQRIIGALLDDYPCPPSDDPGMAPYHSDEVIAEVCEKFDEILRGLDAVRFAARRARRPPRGRGAPPKKQDIRNAYAELARFWKGVFGPEQFTQRWENTKEGLVPTTAASCFLHDAMRLIDPRRPRLGEELRRLMQADIAAIGGRRKGRRA